MICKIKFKSPQWLSFEEFDVLYKFVKTVRKKTPEDIYVYSTDVPDGKDKIDVQREKLEKELNGKDCMITEDYGTVHVCDIIDLLNSLPTIKIEVEEVLISNSSKESTPELLIHKFYEMSERLTKTVDKFNSRCNVNIGGNTLIQFNEVKVELDYCTEALQSELDNGWRIIAVCVQPDGRRPDYVLGKTTIK